MLKERQTLDQLVVAPLSGRRTEKAFLYLGRDGELHEQWSYQDLHDRCTAFAALVQSGTERGSITILLGTEGPSFIEAFFGCILAGVIPVPLRGPRHARDASSLGLLRQVIGQTNASTLICDRAILETLLQADRDGMRLDLTGIRRIVTGELGSRSPASWKPVALDPDQPAYLQFTSGSTSAPRGVVLTHRNVLANLRMMQRVFAHEETLCVAGWLPLHHDMGLGGHVLLPLFEGGFSALMTPSTFLRDPALWLKAFSRFGANGCAVPTFALDLCVRRRVFDDSSLDLRSWKYAYVGSETVQVETLARFTRAFGPRGFCEKSFRPCYGLAEATLLVAGGRSDPPQWTPSTAKTKDAQSLRPLIGYCLHREALDVKILKADTLESLPNRSVGEIFISGPSVSSGYWNATGVELTGAGVPGDPRHWSPTGDLGFIADEHLYLAGRSKDVVIMRGANFAAEDLEHTVSNSHSALQPGDASACFSVERGTEESLIVLQELDRGASAETRQSVLKKIRATLLEAHGLVPTEIVLLPTGTLGRTPNGKICRAQCRAQFLKNDLKRLGAAPGLAESQPEEPRGEDDLVAIIGLAGRFPGAADAEAFWQLLATGQDAIVEVPRDRWDNRAFFAAAAAVPGKLNTGWGGFIDGIDQFDPAFFDCSPHEAREIDPQQRLLLETAWRLFENAGLTPERWEKSEMGVFVGISTNDYLYSKIKLTEGMESFNAYSGLGNANSIAANRISYHFDLRGPSLAVDTACSSSLTAFHLAVESVRKGESAWAIAGGANAILSPGPSITLSQFGMMAPDGRCKSFDERADGYVRAEGCGLVLLKRKQQALQDGDRVLAYVRASGVGQDGRTSGMTRPNGEAQRNLLRKTVASAGLDPTRISYVEAHGTGTIAGDPIEVEQIKAVYGAGDSAFPCYLGSVKASIGHLEAAAGIASVIKAVLMLQHRQIPPQLHLNRLNPQIDLKNSRLEISTTLRPWASPDGPREIAISSFGFGGANAHVLLEEAIPNEVRSSGEETEPQLFVLSAKSESALQQAKRSWSEWLRAHPEVSLEAICSGQALRRTSFSSRAAWIVTTNEDLLRQLEGSQETPSTASDEVVGSAVEMGVTQRENQRTSAHAAASHSNSSWSADGSNGLTVIETDVGKASEPFAQFALRPVQEKSRTGEPPTSTSESSTDVALDRDLAQHALLHPEELKGPHRKLLLANLRNLYLRGAKIQWRILFDPNSATRFDLPGHPFLKQRYWIEHGGPQALARFAAAAATSAQPPVHPIAQEPEDSARIRQFEVSWRPAPFSKREKTSAVPEKRLQAIHWIVVGDGDGLAKMVVDHLRGQGSPTYWLSRSIASSSRQILQRLSGNTGTFNYSSPPGCDKAAYGQLIGQILNLDSTEGAQTWRLLYLDGLACEAPDRTTASTLERDQDLHGVGDLLRLTQAVIDAGRVFPLWIVTRRAQWVDGPPKADESERLSIAQSPLWGFGKTLFLEHPELRGGLVDLDALDTPATIEALLRQASDPEGEHSVAFRGDERYVAQLVASDPAPVSQPLSFRGSGAFLVTGGLGGLGLCSARWLAEHGARDLVLLGRRRFPERAAWSDLPPNSSEAEVVRRIQEIEQTGAQVEIVSADIRDRAALEALFSRIKTSGRKIRGLVHAAGVNWFGKIREMDSQKLLETIKIKVSSSWILHELTRNEDLDCFLGYSSVSALWGSVDLSHYTAANHFLDALCHYRKGLNLPACSIEWGPWAEVGMSAKASESDVLGKLGLRLLPPKTALSLLETPLTRRTAVCVLADIDWRKFKAFVDFSLSPSLFQQVSGQTSPKTEATTPSAGNEHDLSDPEKVTDALNKTVRRALSSVMLIESIETIDDQQRFNLLGMDSLMSIAFAAELERMLGLRLPNTLAYNYPSIRAVVAHLIERLVMEKRIPHAPLNAAGRAAPSAGAREPVRWFIEDPTTKSAVRPRLFCFPYAGTGASSYVGWQERVTSWARLIRVQFPGREERSAEPPLRSIQSLVKALADHFPEEASPFSFFGHSVGAIVAYELGRELRRRQKKLPDHLFLSGCGVPRAEENGALHTLPDPELLQRLSAHLGAPLLSDGRREIVQSMLPLLRADLELLETYRPTEEEPLDCPITVFIGQDDALTPRDRVVQWGALTRGDFILRRFSGGHDFVKREENHLIQTIQEILL